MSGHGDLEQLLSETNQFEPYLRHIRFPALKNLKSRLCIEFLHPITALVGPNGTNKTTILRAIESCPRGVSLGDHWFGTHLDTIDSAATPRVIHGWNPASLHGRTVEVIKQRVERSGNPDYWETAKPKLRDGMERMPDGVGTLNSPRKTDGERNKTRWNPIPKSVLYIDFRAELSAFDKFFYHVPFQSGGSSHDEGRSLQRRRNRVRRVSARLGDAFDDPDGEHVWYRKERVIERSRVLDPAATEAVSTILNRDYVRIQLLKHEFFESRGYTVILENKQHRYSEAFAGSGEFAVVRIVDALQQADPKSLVLLDEPEVSLHPSAQRGLMDFLTIEAVKYKHQVVMATHSPTMVEDLPPNAIKVLEVSASGKVRLRSQSSSPLSAFVNLGHRVGNRTIIVEDDLAKALVEQGIERSDKLSLKSYEVLVEPGGCEVMKDDVVSFSKHNDTAAVVVFDGDQRPLLESQADDADPASNNLDEFLDGNLHKKILSIFGREMNLRLNSNPTIAQREQAAKQLLKWWRERVLYLPGSTSPEQWLAGKSNKVQVGDSSGDCKKNWAEYCELELRPGDGRRLISAEILTLQKLELVALLNNSPETTEELTSLAEAIDERIRL